MNLENVSSENFAVAAVISSTMKKIGFYSIKCQQKTRRLLHVIQSCYFNQKRQIKYFSQSNECRGIYAKGKLCIINGHLCEL